MGKNGITGVQKTALMHASAGLGGHQTRSYNQIINDIMSIHVNDDIISKMDSKQLNYIL